MDEQKQLGERVFRGIAVSPGVCQGKLFVLDPPREQSRERHEVSEEDLPRQVYRFEAALREAREQIRGVQRHIADDLGAEEAQIFDAHALLLQDPLIIEEVTRMIVEERVPAEYAFQQVTERFLRAFQAVDDEFIRARSADLRDVAARVMDLLTGQASRPDALGALGEPCIVIAHDLAPSQTAQLDKRLVLGFATEAGGKTSHTAIMARALRIPAVVGIEEVTRHLVTGEYALLDGYNGQLVINPTDQTLFEYGRLVRRHVTLQEKLRDAIDKPAVTLDGQRVVVSANVEQVADTEAVKASGAEGVGLFRTEYLFVNRENLPDEQEQFENYHHVAAALQPHPVVFRTVDLGGDKFLSHLQVPREMNPFLGWRAIRFCLQEIHIFRAQIRAILRASVFGNVKLMYPMISGLEELLQANELVETCKQELRAEGRAFDEAMEIGAMIEIPSAVLAAEALAKHVQFFSLGTNDLIQYSLAVDRLNEKIAHLYEPTHPAVIKLIKMTADAGRGRGLWVGVCGEMAGDPEMVPLLLGLGVTEFSAAPMSVPQIKYLLRRVKLSEARTLAQFALQCESSKEILAECRKLARACASSLFES